MANERDIDIRLESEDLTGEELHIQSVVGVDAISRLPRYVISAERVAHAQVDEDALMLHPAALSFSIEGEEIHRIHGMITEIRDVAEPHMQHPRYELVLTPRVFSATMREYLDIFLDMSIPSIIEACFTRCGLSAGEHFDLAGLTQTYRSHEFVVQYKETDFAFVSRLCEHHGIFYFVDHSQGKDILVFGDDNSAFPESRRTPELPFLPVDRGGGDFIERIGSVNIVRSPMPRRYTVRDYNYRTPGVDLLASQDVDPNGLGEVIEYGPHFKEPAEGQRFADIRAQELLARQQVWNAIGVCPALCAGQTFMLTQHPFGDVELLVTAVEHRWGAEGATDFASHVTAIVKETPYRAPRLTPKPKVNGIITGVIEGGVKDGYAEVDEQGRYRVRFMFDTAERGEGQASRLVRMAQPHSGEGYGMHFPLRPGTEVILSCIDGDPDRPIITGTVPNPKTASPVSSANRDRNLIRTGGGNEIDISDEDGAHRIKMTTPHEGTVFQLGAPNAEEAGAIISTTANIVSQAAGTVGAACDVASTIQELNGSLTGKNATSIAGLPNPITGFEAVAKLASSGIGAVKALSGLVDSVAGAPKKIADARKKDGASRLKEMKAELLKIDPEQKYPDDANYVTTSDGQKVYETREQWEKRVLDQRLAYQSDAYRSQYNEASTNASSDPKDAYADSYGRKIWGGGLAALDIGNAMMGAGQKAMKASKKVKKLFSTTHKDIQALADKVEFGAARANVAEILGAVGTSAPRGGWNVRMPGEHYNLIAATDSVVNHGLQGNYSVTASVNYTYGIARTMVASNASLCLFGGTQAELAARTVKVTSTTMLDVESRQEIKVKSGQDTTVVVGNKLTVTSDKDTKLESKTKFFQVAKDLWEVDAGDAAKLKAKKWAIDSTEADVKVKVKGAWDAAVEGRILWEHNKKSRFYANGGEILAQYKNGGRFLANSSEARLEKQSGGAKLAMKASGATLDAKSKLDVKAGTISVNGKVLLG